MYVGWHKPQKRNGYYATLYHNHWNGGKIKKQYIAYLGANPAAKLKKLIGEGRLTKEQAAKITFSGNNSTAGNELRAYLEQLKKECELYYCEKLKDYCQYKKQAILAGEKIISRPGLDPA